MAGPWDRALEALIARLDGAVWPDEVVSAVAAIRGIVDTDRLSDDELLVEILQAFDAVSSYDPTDAEVVDFGDAITELAAALNAGTTATGGADPSFAAAPALDPQQLAP